MSRKSPAFSFYPDSWFGGTGLMPPIQRAAYIDLLALQWVSGSFSKEEAKLFVRGVPDADIEAVIEAKFEEVESCRFSNPRLEEEREKQGKRSQAASKNGKKGGRPKSQTKAKPKANSKAKQKPRQKLSVSVSDSVSNTGAVDKHSPAPKDFRELWEAAKMPERFDNPQVFEQIERWHGTRRLHGVPIPFNAMELRTVCESMTRSNLKGGELLDCLSMCAERGWKNFNVSLWMDKREKETTKKQSQYRDLGGVPA